MEKMDRTTEMTSGMFADDTPKVVLTINTSTAFTTLQTNLKTPHSY